MLSGPTNQIDALSALHAFGYSVAAGDFDGNGTDDILIGAPNDYGGVSGGSGKAYIFNGTPAHGFKTLNQWTNGASSSTVGYASSVACAGDVNGDGRDDFIIGIRSEGFQVYQGRAVLYLGPQAGASGNAAWAQNGTQPYQEFGHSVASAGDVNGDGFDDVIIGAPGTTVTQPSEGAAFLFLGNSTGLPSSAAWTYASGQSGSQFGLCVASAGDVNGDGKADVVIGARSFDNGEVDEGRAFVFLGTASGLSPTPAWTAESNQVAGLFADCVASAGDVNQDGYGDVVIGAPKYDAPGVFDAGAAFVYLGSAAGLSAVPAWSRTGTQASGNLGIAVLGIGDLDGDGFGDIAVGADQIDLPGRLSAGVVYVHRGTSSGVAVVSHATLGGDATSAHYGFSLAAGDVNGDGSPDLLVGSPRRHMSSSGKVQVILGLPRIVASIPQWMHEGEYGAEFGSEALASAGDVNGDGFDDVVVGAPQLGGSGYAQVFHGSAQGIVQQASWTSLDGHGDDGYADSVASAGDVDGDGFDDVIVGAAFHSNGQFREGATFLYRGSASGTVVNPSWIAEGNLDNAFFGVRVSGAGDVNGDGFDDVIVGANSYASPLSFQGKAFVYLGSPTGLGSVEAWSITGTNANDEMGRFVAGVGDVNADGFDDIVVGGAANYLFLGSPTGPASTFAWSTDATSAFPMPRGPAAAAGDVNGDGYDDVVLGQSGYQLALMGGGRAVIFLGTAAGLSPQPFWSVLGERQNASFGGMVSGAGDVDGDGFDDVLVSARLEGRMYLYRGSGSGVMSQVPVWITGSKTNESVESIAVGAGDVNGDALADVLVGVAGGGGAFFGRGRARVHLGGTNALFVDCDMNGQADDLDVAFRLATDLNLDFVPDSCAPPLAWSFCEGAPPVLCPCGNSGAPGRGCSNSLPGNMGARLKTIGNASIAADTCTLVAEDVTGTAIFVYGSVPFAGFVFAMGDGLQCIQTNVVRLGPVPAVAGTATYPSSGAASSLHAASAISLPGTKQYQCWYRDAQNFCTTSSLNSTQGLTVYWLP